MLSRKGSQGKVLSVTPPDAPGANKESQIHYFTPRDYQIPRKTVVKGLEFLDAKDSPDRPGMLLESTLKAMVARFDLIFGNANSAYRKEKIRTVMEHLQRHTKRRWGEMVEDASAGGSQEELDKQAQNMDRLIEWEQTSRVYELFTVELNVFERIFFTVDVSESTSVLSKICSISLISMILLSIVLWMISTMPAVQTLTPEGCDWQTVGGCAPKAAQFFITMETVSVGVFTFEYLVKLLTVHSVRFELLQNNFLFEVLTETNRCAPDGGNRQGRLLDGPIKTTLKHFFDLPNIVDLLAILPFWIETLSASSDKKGGFLMVLRVLRLTRIFRVFKVGKYNDVFTLFKRVVEQSIPALLLMLFFIALGLCLFGTLIWFTEAGVWHPEGNAKLAELGISGRGAYLRRDASNGPNNFEESPFTSIIASFWFVIVTITTVGYGEPDVPRTWQGKIVGGVMILSGIIVLAMPIGVVGANFSKEYYKAIHDKEERARMKKQSDMQSAQEQEQDAALAHDGDGGAGGSLDAPLPFVMTELNRVDICRQKILVRAQMIDVRWQEVLPDVLYSELSKNLRHFLAAFLGASGEEKQGNHVAQNSLSRPVISTLLLNELDTLCTRVNAALAAVTSVEDLAEFGLEEAVQCRRDWRAFVDLCWAYTVDLCEVKAVGEPFDLARMNERCGA